MNANHFKEYFNFSKKERIGIVALLILIAVLWLIPSYFSGNNAIDEKDALSFRQEVAAFKASQSSSKKRSDDTGIVSSKSLDHTLPVIQSSLFYFDPNTLSQMGWQQLGINDRTIKTIKNYTSKGGRFYQAEDLGKIFGLKKEDYNRLLPYVRIEKDPKVVSGEKKTGDIVVDQQPRKKFNELIDVNTADTSSFIKLPGIGSKLAARIVSFRNKLGGFYTIDQVAEVYGIHDTVFQKIKHLLVCPAPLVHKMNINTVTLDTLKAHPYIKYQIANAVIQYREQHGKFKSATDIKEIHLVTGEILQKILPYITID